MPELNTFLDLADELSLVQFILEEGGRLVGSRHPSPQYQMIRDMESYMRVRTDERLFYVLFDVYDECPLDLRRINGGYYEGKYAIMPRNSGPMIDFLTSVEYQKGGSNWVSGGGISYYPTYWNTMTNSNEKPPAALVAIYKSRVMYVKQSSTVVKGKFGTYFIGAHTYRRIKEGDLRVAEPGLDVE